MRKQIITQLICHFRLDISELMQDWDFDFYQHFNSELKELQGMIDDGLITLQEGVIEVQPRGRLLLRNICMVFDEYLKQNVVRFSRVI